MKLTRRLYHFFDELIGWFIYDCEEGGFIYAVKTIPVSFYEAKDWFTAGKN